MTRRGRTAPHSLPLVPRPQGDRAQRSRRRHDQRRIRYSPTLPPRLSRLRPRPRHQTYHGRVAQDTCLRNTRTCAKNGPILMVMGDSITLSSRLTRTVLVPRTIREYRQKYSLLSRTLARDAKPSRLVITSSNPAPRTDVNDELEW